MPKYEILISAINTPKREVGEICSVKRSPASWGKKEGPPNYLLVTTDLTEKRKRDFDRPIRRELTIEKVKDINGGKRMRISVNPKIVARFGLKGDLPKPMRDYIVSKSGEYQPMLSVSGDHYVFDIRRPITPEKLMGELRDLFDFKIKRRRHRMKAAAAAALKEAGGKVAKTQVELDADMEDEAE